MSISFSFSTSGLRDQAVQNVMSQAKTARANKSGGEAGLIVAARDAICESILKDAAAEDTVSVSASFSGSVFVKKAEPKVESDADDLPAKK